jgi:hypothetical protein
MQRGLVWANENIYPIYHILQTGGEGWGGGGGVRAGKTQIHDLVRQLFNLHFDTEKIVH